LIKGGFQALDLDIGLRTLKP